MREKFGLKEVGHRKIYTKILGSTLLITVASVGLLSLLVIKSFQDIIKEHVIQETEERLGEAVSLDLIDKKAIESRLKYGPRGRALFLEVGAVLPKEEFSDQSGDYFLSRSSGILEDLRNDVKIVVFSESAALNQKIVNIVYLTDFYGPLREVVWFFVMGTFFVLILVLATVIFISRMISGSITQLTSAVKNAEKGSPFLLNTASGDEIEELSHAFSHFIGESIRLRSGLEKTVAERTAQLSEKMQRLEELNEVMVGRELEMKKLKEEIEKLKLRLPDSA